VNRKHICLAVMLVGTMIFVSPLFASISGAISQIASIPMVAGVGSTVRYIVINFFGILIRIPY